MKSLLILSVFVATLAGISDAIEILVNTNDAPDLYNFGQTVKSVLESNYEWIRKELMSPDFIEIQRIQITFSASYDGVAYAAGGQIVGGVGYYRSHQDDVGSMIHEMVHIIQGYKNCAGWFTEGLADYIRYFKYEPHRKPSKPGPEHRYDEGYGVSAYFLNYIQQRVRQDMLYWTNKDCREGTYNDSIWPRLTGKDLQTLWNDMQRDG